MTDKPKPSPEDQHAPDEDVTQPLGSQDVDATKPLAGDDIDATRPIASDDIDVTRPLDADADEAADFMSQPSDAIFGANAAAPPEQIGDVLQIGSYAIIGSPAPTKPGAKPRKYIDGGEGRVYLAQHIGDKTTVVLKTPLPQHAADPVRCARLIREAQQLKNMNHPGIVKIHEINPDSEPPYYTMQHLAGGALSSKLVKGEPLPKEQVLKLAIPLADAVRYVNDELGISHRDIKPANVMLDAEGKPYFIDFGLSRDNTGDEVSITDHRTPNTNRFKVGTARYMAPELFDGKAGNAQTDIYAFGIMLYEMATGGRPYEANDYNAINQMKRMRDPDLPTQVYPDIDKGLAAVIEHALARRIRDRYATMEDLHEDLCLVQDGSPPLHATPLQSDAPIEQTVGSQEETGGKKSKVPLLVATIALLAVVGGGIGYALSQDDAEDETIAEVTEDDSTSSNEDNDGGDVLIAGTTTATGGDDGTANGQSSDTQTGGITDPIARTGDVEDLPGELIARLPSERGDVPQGVGEVIAPTTQDPTSAAPTTPTQPTNNPAAKPVAPAPQFAALFMDIRSEFMRSDTVQRDAEIAEKVTAMGNAQPPDRPDPAVRKAYGPWLHRAASTGMPKTLAALLKNAKAFGASQGVLDSSGHTWLQSAIASPSNTAFAASFPDWLANNNLDPAIIEKTEIGTRKPIDQAKFLGRDAWVAALTQAKQQAEAQ
ncbi:MAG: serine/threonine-protein kinase [Phycisphaeraceae bacterium]